MVRIVAQEEKLPPDSLEPIADPTPQNRTELKEHNYILGNRLIAKSLIYLGFIEPGPEEHEEVRVTAPDPSRRDFLKVGVGVALGGAFWANNKFGWITGIAVDLETGAEKEEKERSVELQEERAGILESVLKNGIEEKWDTLVVFPGVMTLNRGVKLYTNPTLKKEFLYDSSALDSPNVNLLLRAPIFVSSTLIYHRQELGSEELPAHDKTTISPDTMAFQLFNGGGIMYFNYKDNRDYVGLHMRNQEFWEGRESPIGPQTSWERVNGRLKANGVTYSYATIEADEDNPVERKMLLGASIWTSYPDDTMYRVAEYMSDPTTEPIYLPKQNEVKPPIFDQLDNVPIIKA